MPTNDSKSSRPVWLGEDRRTWDHARVHLQLLHDERVGAYDLAVYVGLVAHAETQSGRCFPAVATLAKYIDVNERTVRRSVARLEEWGYIALVREQGRANTYTILPPPPLSFESGVGINPGTSVQGPRTQVPTPRTQVPGTPDSGADERERTINKNHSTIEKLSTEERLEPHEDHEGRHPGEVFTPEKVPSNFEGGLAALRSIRGGVK